MGVCVSNASGQSVVVTNGNSEHQHAAHVEVSEVKEDLMGTCRLHANFSSENEGRKKSITNRNAAKRLAFTSQSRSELSLPQLDSRRGTVASNSTSSRANATVGTASSQLIVPKPISPMSVVSTKNRLPSRLNSLTQTSHCGVSISVDAEGSVGLGIGQGIGEVQRVRHSSFNSGLGTLCGSAASRSNNRARGGSHDSTIPHLNLMCAVGSRGGVLPIAAVHSSSSNRRGISLPPLPSPPHAKAKARGLSCIGVEGDSNAINTPPRGPLFNDVAGQRLEAFGQHSVEDTVPTVSVQQRKVSHVIFSGPRTAGAHPTNHMSNGERENREDVRIVEINLSSVAMSSQCNEEPKSSSLLSSSSSVSFSGDSDLFYATRLISVTYDTPPKLATNTNPAPGIGTYCEVSGASSATARSGSVDRDSTRVPVPLSLADRRGGGSFRSARFHSAETPCSNTMHAPLFSPSTIFTPRPTSEGIHNAFKPLRFPEVVRAHRMAIKKAHEAVRTLASIGQGPLVSSAPPRQVLPPQLPLPQLEPPPPQPSRSKAVKMLEAQAINMCAVSSPRILQEIGEDAKTACYGKKAEAREIVTFDGTTSADAENVANFSPYSPLFIEAISRSSTEEFDATFGATSNHHSSIGIGKRIKRRLLSQQEVVTRSPLPYVPEVLVSSAETADMLDTVEELSLRGKSQTARTQIPRDGGEAKGAGEIEIDDPAESSSAQLSPTSCGSPTFLLPSVRAVSSCDFFAPAPPNASRDNGSGKRGGMLMRVPSNISSCGSSAYMQAGSSTTLCNSSYGQRLLAYGAPSGNGDCSVAQRRGSGEQLSFVSQTGDGASRHASSVASRMRRRSSRESSVEHASVKSGGRLSSEGSRPTWENTEGVPHTTELGGDKSCGSAPTLQRRPSVVTLLL